MVQQGARGAMLMALGVLAAAGMLRAPITSVPPSLAASSLVAVRSFAPVSTGAVFVALTVIEALAVAALNALVVE